MDLVALRKKVAEKGEKDKRKLSEVVHKIRQRRMGGELLYQVISNARSGYEIWDAVSMWLGAAENDIFDKNDVVVITSIAEDYINGKI